MRSMLAVAWLLAVAPLLTTLPAGAQVQPAGLTLDLDEVDLELEPGTARTVNLTVTNTGETDGTVELTVEMADPWKSTLPVSVVDLPSGASRTVDLKVASPTDRMRAGEPVGFTVTGVLTDTTGQFQATDQADGQAVLTVPPAASPPSNTMVRVIDGLWLLGLIGVAVWWGTRSKPEAPSIEVGRVVRTYGRVVLPVFLRNDAREGTTVLLSVEGAPDGWGVGFNLPEVFLEPGEEMRVWLALNPPGTDLDAQASFDIVARSVGGDLEAVARDVAVDLGDLPPPREPVNPYQVER